MAQCSMKWKAPGDTDWWFCVRDSGHKGQHQDDRGRKFFNPPYPFCRHKDLCVNGRCESEMVCND